MSASAAPCWPVCDERGVGRRRGKEAGGGGGRRLVKKGRPHPPDFLWTDARGPCRYERVVGSLFGSMVNIGR